MKITPEWIDGFIDGNGGGFSVPAVPKIDYMSEEKKFAFLSNQDRRSTDMLYAMKKEFACGSVERLMERAQYSINNLSHLRDKCVPFFMKHPLQGDARFSFYHFAQKLEEHMKSRGEEWNLPSVTTSDHHHYQLSAGWFRGYVDARGCFSVPRVSYGYQPLFSLDILGDTALLKECHSLINCGRTYRRADGRLMLEVSALGDLEEKLFPFFETRGSNVLLRTIKRISYQKFRRIVRFLQLGRHSTPGGVKKIEKLRITLNQHNKIWEQ